MVGAAAKPKTITACANKKTGVMRYSASNKCTKLESTVSLGNSVKNATDITALSKKTDAFIAAGTKGLVDIGTSLTGTIAPALTALGTAAGLYADFEYGVAQLYAGDDPMSLAFVMTPRLDPTVNMSIATASFPCLAAAPKADGTAVTTGCDVGDKITARVAVRSVNDVANDKKSTVMCGVNVNQGATGGLATSRWVQTLSSTTGPIVPITRSPLAPVSAADKAVFLVGLKSTDTAVDVTAATNSVNQKYVSQETQNAITKASTGTAGTDTSGVGGFLAQNTNDMTGATASYTALATGLTLLATLHTGAAAAIGLYGKATGIAAVYTASATQQTLFATTSTAAAAQTTKALVAGVYTTAAAAASGATATALTAYATAATATADATAAIAYATAQAATATGTATLFTGFATAATATADATAAIAYATAQATANTAAAEGMTASAAALPNTNAGLIQLELRCVTVPKP